MKIIDNLQKNSIVWQPDFQASLDENGQWTASQSFKCKPEDVQELIPSRGDACQKDGWEVLKLITVQVSEAAGSGWETVTCNYRGTVYEFDEDEDQENIEPTYTTSVVAQSEPIEAHPKFKDITAAEWADAQWYKDGRIIRDPEDQTAFKRNVWVEDDKQWQPIEDYTPTGELPALFEAYDKGFTAFYSPRITFSMRYASNQPIPAATLNKIGKIDTPQNAPAVGAGRTWLAMGANSDQSDNVYDVELEWMLSGKEGWDEDFYD